MDNTLQEIFKSFGGEFYRVVSKIEASFNEIRIRSDRVVVFYLNNKPYFADYNGNLIPQTSDTAQEKAFLTVYFEQLKNAFNRLCEYSVYKHQSDINNGFITVKGGHRIGVCGTAVVANKDIKTVTDITSLNIRIARQYIGCADTFFKKVNYQNGVLICGIPSSGKTTMLREISRKLSLNYGNKISVIDERLEISSLCNGKIFFDLGLSDVYCNYPKKTAIFQAIRTMSPHFIVCDELTGDDLESVMSSVNFGVKLIASVHCDCLKNALKNPSILRLLKTGAFQKLIFLDENTPCKIKEVYDVEDLKID